MPSPMLRATLEAAALSSTSNILAQFLSAYREQKPFVFDLALLLRFCCCTLILTPPNYRWQQFLEQTFPAYAPRGNAPGPTHDIEKQDGVGGAEQEKITEQQEAEPERKLNIRNTLAKWFIDCITVGAIFNTAAFFIVMGILKAQSLDKITHNVRYETIPVILAGYKIWPFASIVSFSCIPVERRIVFLNFIGLIWGIYMSLVAAAV